MSTVYSLKTHNNTGGLHIFEAEEGGTILSCTPKTNSRCNKVTLTDCKNIPSVLSCKDAKTMRLECAKIGTPVCGQCVGTLYAPFDGVE